jgi:FkbM family methyltransferase
MKHVINRALRSAFGLTVTKSTSLDALIADRSALAALRTELDEARKASDETRKALSVDMTKRMHVVFGSRMYANPDDLGLQIYPLVGMIPEQAGGEIAYIARNVKPGQKVLDLGANIGLMTLLLANRVGPSGHVHAFEPGPLSFGLLQTNIALNGLRNITTHNVACADFAQNISLYVCKTGESDNRITGVPGVDSDGFYAVPTHAIAVDDVVTGSIDFVKIDIQGAEYRAIQGMQKTIERSPRIEMIVEYAPAGLAIEPAEYLSFLASLGFSFYDVPETGIEQPVSATWIMSNIGPPHLRHMTNLLLRRG